MNIIKIKTAFSLGLFNLARVIIYKLGIKAGLNRVRDITSDVENGDFFFAYVGSAVNYARNRQWEGQHTYFGNEKFDLSIPNWHKNCLNSALSVKDKPWYLIGDFSDELGDIKGVWEASRFDWLIGFAQHAKCGDKLAIDKINNWITNWIINNPPYDGVNWKCGQEASIRVMHLALAAMLLDQTKNTSNSLLTLVKAHLKRISPTIMYAVAQDNNHGTSEAAALFIGGSWLSINGDVDGVKWQKQGVKWLENRARCLIEDDGSFSQYSVTYHRVMLDTYSLVEVWRKNHDLPRFSSDLYFKLKVATDWLFYFTDSKSGDSPNLGANDGARLIPLTGTDYRDFRPCIQLASVLFLDKIAYKGSGNFNIPLQWLNINRPNNQIEIKKSRDFDKGGCLFLTNDNAQLYLKYPNYKFRPSQCDALHVDFWVRGENIFRDGGTFSYNAGQKYIDYYGGTKSHNTVRFDNHEQMPRLSRFLLGGWLKLNYKNRLVKQGEAVSFGVGYNDRFGCLHKRDVSLLGDQLIVVDRLSGFNERAVLRWRLTPDVKWLLSGTLVYSDVCKLKISSNVAIKRVELVTGYESRYYYQENQIPVLEVEIENSGILTTEVNF